MSLCSDGSTDESESSEEEELITWRYQKSTKHGANVCFKPEVVIEPPNKQRKQIGVQNNLTFKFVRSSTGLIRNILTAYGFKEAREASNDYNLMWLNSHVKPYSLRNLMDFQRVNHFPRSYELTRKNLLARNVERMAQNKNAKLFDFCPKSYMMPGQYQDFCHAAAREKGPWIVKPQASSRGRGIFLVNSPSQVPLDDSTMVCRYIHNPLLIDGFKFDVRLYVAVTCYDPLIIYLYEEGMARFATIKYETSLKSIKNQWMHLTNYSINKKNPEFVRCEDAEQEDFGNKWTLGALLRYLRDDGIDTAALMSRIEQVVIKTIISVEGQIAAACKTFVPYRGNCAELYGFDVLIDDTLKPWILEVNLSPSLATDAPLDLKLKSHVIADFLNLMGVESVDPLSRRSKDARLNHAYNLGRSTKNAPSAPSSGSYDTTSLSPEDIKLLRWVQDQNERRGGFLRIFPRADTWANYGALLEYKTHTNELLASRLFKETYRPYSSVVRNKFNERTESSRFVRYEERLDPLDKTKKKKKRKRLKKKKEKSSAAENFVENDDYEDEDFPATQIETISMSSQSQQSIPTVSSGTSTRRQIPENAGNEAKTKQVKKSVQNSEIYKSIKEAQKKKTEDTIPKSETKKPISEPKDAALDITSLEDLPDAISSSQMELVTKKILAEAGRLSQIEAREAFVTYLRRLQLRFLNAANEKIRDTNITQMDLVCRFLRKASSNLQNPMEIKIPTAETGIPMLQRKRILGDLLVEFIARYEGDTEMMLADNPVFSDVVDRPLFQKFCMSCKESEVEEILTKYTTENKSASVFLGAKKRAKEKRHATGQLESRSQEQPAEKQESSIPVTSPVKVESVESTGIPAAEKQSPVNIVKSTGLESPYSIVQQQSATNRGRSNFSAGKSRVRSASQEPKLLKRDNREANQIPPSSKAEQAPPYPSSCRDAAFIYSAVSQSSQKQNMRPSIVPRADFSTALNPRVNTASHFSSATSSDAIKLALKGLDRHNTQAEHKTVTELAKQLARVKLNQNIKKRPTSATTIQHQRHQRYNRPNSTTDRTKETASDFFSIPSRTKQRPFSATTSSGFIPQDALIPKPPPKPCWR